METDDERALRAAAAAAAAVESVTNAIKHLRWSVMHLNTVLQGMPDKAAAQRYLAESGVGPMNVQLTEQMTDARQFIDAIGVQDGAARPREAAVALLFGVRGVACFVGDASEHIAGRARLALASARLVRAVGGKATRSLMRAVWTEGDALSELLDAADEAAVSVAAAIYLPADERKTPAGGDVED